MNKIIILGTSGHMKEQLEWIEDMMDYKKIKCKIIFCSDKKIFKNYDIISEKKIKKNIGKLYLAIGSPNIRSKLISKFKNFDFFSLIHPSAKISKNVKIGKGVSISPNCIITSNVKLGDFNNLNCGVGIFHDCKIDINNTFSPGAKILGGCKIGKSNFFGTNSCVKENSKIGNHNTLGASSFLNFNLGNYKKVGGVPAKNIK